MPIFSIETTQEFVVTYEVEADTAGDAWEALLMGYGDPVHQVPGNITDTRTNSRITQAEVAR